MLTITKKEYDELIKAIEDNTAYNDAQIRMNERQIETLKLGNQYHQAQIDENALRLTELKAERENAPDL